MRESSRAWREAWGTSWNTVPCLHCLREATGRVRFDRRGRPYTTCVACGAKSFLPTPEALNGIAFLAPRVIAMMRDALAQQPDLEERIAQTRKDWLADRERLRAEEEEAA